MGSLLALAEGMRTLGLLVTLLVATPQAATDQKPVVPGRHDHHLGAGDRLRHRSPESRPSRGDPQPRRHAAEPGASRRARRAHRGRAAATTSPRCAPSWIPAAQARVFFVMGRAGRARSRRQRQRALHRRAGRHHRRAGRRADAGAARRPAGARRQAPRFRRGGSAAGAHRTRAAALRRVAPHPARERGRPHPARVRGSQEGAAAVAALRAAPIERRSITRSRAGAATWTSASATATIRFTPIVAIDNADDLSRSTPATGCASKRGSWARGGSAPASSGPGSIRTGAAPRWTRSRSSPTFRGRTTTRSTITPLLKFAFTPDLSIAGGREHLGAGTARRRRPSSQMANAAVASIDFDRRWNGRVRCDAPRRRPASACAPALASSKAISPTRRYLGQGSYRFDFGRHHVQATGMAGGITGHAPLFERFTLGDSTTLRGWDKYDIAPAGGDRVFYSSVEYRYTGLGALPRRRFGLGREHRTAGPRLDGLRIPRRAGVLRRRLPAEHRQSDAPSSRWVCGSPGSGSGGSASPAGRRGACSPCSRGRPLRSSAQALTVDTVGDALRIRAPGFSFLKGEPLARLKDGRSVRVELAAMVLAGAGEVAGGHGAPDLRVELRSLGGTIRRDRGGCALPVRLAPDAGGRRGVVRRAAGDPAQRARRAGPRRAVLDSARVPHARRRRARRIQPDSGYTLQGLIDALSRRRKTESSPHALEAGPFRTAGARGRPRRDDRCATA